MNGTLEGTGQKAQKITGPQGRLAWFLSKATRKPQCVPALTVSSLSWAKHYSRGNAQTITRDGFQVGVTEPSIHESYYYFLRCSPG